LRSFQEVILYPLPNVDLGADITLFPGDVAELEVEDGYETYLWNNQAGSNTYTISFDDITGDTIIIVDVTDFTTCKNSDEILIEIFKVQIPIVLTPNGDGENDSFEPKDGWSAINSHKMVVFNRWGQKVWESSDFTSGWDGKDGSGHYVAEGTYFWVLEVFYGPDDVKKVYKGSLTVLGTGN